MRSLTDFWLVVQNQELKEALTHYTKAGAMPDYISDKPVKLTAKERKALELAQDWAAKSVTPSRDGNGRVLYVHGASLPTVIASPFQVCDVELQPGETLNEVVVGDSARWLVDVSKSGSGENETVHLLIKPVDAGLETSAVVTTNRRVYHLRLVSERSGHTPYVGFTYQEDHAVLLDTVFPDGHQGQDLHAFIASAAREILNKADNELSGVVSTAVANLALYRDPVVARNIGRSDFRLADLMTG